MTTPRARLGGLCLAGLLWAAGAGADPLTAERAVAIALQKSTSIVNARAGVFDARSGLYGAYSGMLPSITGDWSRSVTRTENVSGTVSFGATSFPSTLTEQERYGTTPALNGRWSVLNLSNLAGLSSARSSMRAAQLSVQSARSDVALETRRRFYNTVNAYHLSRVAGAALKLARDDERRVRALFEVGSVSRSDLLKAQVRTATSQLDSLTAHQELINQRISLAEMLAMREAELGEVDTVLTAEPHDYEEGAMLSEAGKNRPDLQAAEAELRAARQGVNSARFGWLPYVTVTGGLNLTSSASTKSKQPIFRYANGTSTQVVSVDTTLSSGTTTDRVYQGTVALNWDLFDGLQTNSRIAAAKARLLRAEESRNALTRNLEAEVHQAVLVYREAIEREAVADRSLESATENLKLTQQKYNVGSTTILDLIDAQVSLARADADRVTALAGIRIAEAQLNRVRGRVE